ncbi:MAG: MMPL family transporter [Bdellovibrionales bacterium]|nr:MMPL family transporter [Bdellovibrionales bacterium]
MTPIQKTGISGKVADLVLKHPKKLLLAGLAMLALLVPGLGRLGTDFSYRIWFRADDPLLARFDAFERRFGNDDQAFVAVHSPSGLFDAESAALLRRMTEEMWQLPEVIRVDSLANYSWVHADGDDILVEPFLGEEGTELSGSFLAERKAIALRDETIPNYLMSADAKTALLYATIQPTLEGTPDYQKITVALKALADKHASQGDHRIYVAGTSTLSDSFREATEHDLSRLVPITLLVIVVFLWFSFRSLAAVGATLVVVFTTILATLGTYGWVGMKFNNTTAIVPQILIAVAVADSVHLLVTYLKAINAGKSRRAAAEYSLVKNFAPTVLTSVTTAVGFFSFAQAKIVPIASMGIGAGMGTIYAWVLTALFIAPMMVLLPMKSSLAAETESEADERIAPSIDRFTRGIERHSRKIVALGVLVAASAAVFASRNIANSDPFEYFADDYHLSVANDFIEKEVGGGLGVEIVIDSGGADGIKDPAWLRKVEEFQGWVETLPKVTKVVSLVDILKSMNRALNAGKQEAYRLPDSRETVAQLLFLYSMSLPQGMDLNNRITVENDALRMTAMSSEHGSNEAVALFKRVEQRGAELGLNVQVTGKGPHYQEMNGYVVPTFTGSVLWSTLLISLIMIFALRSLKLGLVSMIPNLLPNVVGAAVVYLLGLHLDVGTVVVASVCLGIAVDDTIHFLVNYARAVRTGSTAREAVAWVYQNTGNAMMVTTLVLVASFGTFVLADFTPNANFGKLVAIVLTVALVCELFLTSALLILLEKWLVKPRPAVVADAAVPTA